MQDGILWEFPKKQNGTGKFRLNACCKAVYVLYYFGKTHAGAAPRLVPEKPVAVDTGVNHHACCMPCGGKTKEELDSWQSYL